MVLGWLLRAPSGIASAPDRLTGGKQEAGMCVPRSAREAKARHVVNMDGTGVGTGEGAAGARMDGGKREGWCCSSGFQMPLHYPRYKKEDYEQMEEWKVDMVLRDYGLSCEGTLQEKRAFAMGAFLWPDQL